MWWVQKISWIIINPTNLETLRCSTHNFGPKVNAAFVSVSHTDNHSYFELYHVKQVAGLESKWNLS